MMTQIAVLPPSLPERDVERRYLTKDEARDQLRTLVLHVVPDLLAHDGGEFRPFIVSKELGELRGRLITARKRDLNDRMLRIEANNILQVVTIQLKRNQRTFPVLRSGGLVEYVRNPEGVETAFPSPLSTWDIWTLDEIIYLLRGALRDFDYPWSRSSRSSMRQGA
jgi:hypothetical protein